MLSQFQPLSRNDAVDTVPAYSNDSQHQDAGSTSVMNVLCIINDGNINSVGSERYRFPEVLSQPSFIGKECVNIRKNLRRVRPNIVHRKCY